MHACAAALATVQLMRTPWLVPAPHRCASEQNGQFGLQGLQGLQG